MADDAGVVPSPRGHAPRVARSASWNRMAVKVVRCGELRVWRVIPDQDGIGTGIEGRVESTKGRYCTYSTVVHRSRLLCTEEENNQVSRY